MTENSGPILLTRAAGVATITINRPERLNAMDSQAHLALSDALDRVAADEAVRVVVLTGSGERAFSAGRDLKELATASDDERAAADARSARTTRLTDRFNYPKPIVARVRGLALGGGFELALACDIIVASDDASFALPEPRRGLIPSAGGVHRLPRQMPLKTAMGYLLTGRSMDAARAFALGVVNEVVPAADLDAAVASWAADIIACAPLSTASIKQSAMAGLGRPLQAAIGATYDTEERRKASRDAIEGPLAFAQKRAPVWVGA